MQPDMQPDIEVLCVEPLFQHNCQKNRTEIKTIAQAARLAMEFGRIFPLTSRCYRLIQTAPVTSAASERSFSKLKLIKTVVRSVMNQDRLNDFLILSSEKDLISDSIDLEQIVCRWAELPKTKRIINV